MSISSPTEITEKRGLSSANRVIDQIQSTEITTADIEPPPASSSISSLRSHALPPVSHYLLTQQEEENILRRSLKEIAEDIQKMQDFITLTEDSIRREREYEHRLFFRDHKVRASSLGKNAPGNSGEKKLEECGNAQKPNESKPTKKAKRKFSLEKIRRKLRRGEDADERRKTDGSKSTKSSSADPKPITFKINSNKSVRKMMKFSPQRYKSRLYFRNGKVGCIEAEKDNNNLMNIQKTHAFVKGVTEKNVENLKPPSISPNIVDFSDDSSPSYNDVCDSLYFNFDFSNEESRPDGLDDSINDYGDIEMQSINSKEEMVEVEVEKRVSDDRIDPSEERSNSLNIIHYENEGAVNSANERNDETKIQKSESSLSLPSNITLNSEIKNQVRYLVRRFTMRTGKMRSRLEVPVTPSSTTSSTSSIQAASELHDVDEMQSSPSSNRLRTNAIFKADEQHLNLENPFLCPYLCGRSQGGKHQGVLDPQGYFYISWLCIVSMTFLYNAWVIPLRSTFPFQTPENTNIWLAVDFCADIIYLMDIIFIKHRIMYLYEGFWVRDKDLTRKNYMHKLQFKLDILSLIPLDLLYLKLGTSAVYLRAPRLLKIQSFWELFRLLDRVIASPYLVRVGRTLTYMLYMIHITACTYYAYSDYQGLGTDRWVFSGKGHPYVRCFAFATKTATSIGKNPKPDSEGELLFMTAAWLMGVFVFALLIGQIRDIIATATRSQTEYRQLVDETLECMRTLNLPADSVDRVKKWFKYTWEQQRTLDESLILDYLPSNLKTDIAIAVHIQTLSKVQLFADCEEALLRELVLKLRSVTFLPDDYVCRKNEIGKEMYIIKWGQVRVMGGVNNDEVLATLSEGSVFGEISLLSINGIEGKRRTADVRSKGFSNLFVLSKSDLNEAIAQYPQAQAILKKRAQSLMRKNANREREQAVKIFPLENADVVIANPSTPPSSSKLLETVIKALPEDSPAVCLLTQGSRRRASSFRHNLDHKSKSKDVENKETVDEVANTLAVDSNELKVPSSPDLLSAIQMTLQNQNSFINLTDAEKALMSSDKALDSQDSADKDIEAYELEEVEKVEKPTIEDEDEEK